MDFAGYGICSSKAMQCSGRKLHTDVSLTSVIMGCIVTSAAAYGNQTVVELLDSMRASLKVLLGDGVYNNETLQAYLAQYQSLTLLAPTKVKQPPRRTKVAQKALNRLRLIGETVNAQPQEQLSLSRYYTKSPLGMYDSYHCQAGSPQHRYDGQPYPWQAITAVGGFGGVRN